MFKLNIDCSESLDTVVEHCAKRIEDWFNNFNLNNIPTARYFAICIVSQADILFYTAV